MDLTLSYKVEKVYIRPNYLDYSNVIEQIKYSITGKDHHGRSATITDICTLPLGNTGYLGYKDYSDVTESDLIKLVKVDIGGSPQEIQNIADIEKAIRLQTIPTLSEVNITS